MDMSGYNPEPTSRINFDSQGQTHTKFNLELLNWPARPDVRGSKVCNHRLFQPLASPSPPPPANSLPPPTPH